MSGDNDEQWLKQHVRFLNESEWEKGQFWIAVVMLLSMGNAASFLLDKNLVVACIFGNWALIVLILGALRREHRRREILQRRYFRILCGHLGVNEDELQKAGLNEVV